MTSFLGGTAGQDGAIVFRADDKRVTPQWWDPDDWRWVPRDARWTLVGYATPWWPGGLGLDASSGDMLAAIWHGQPEVVSGASSRYGFAGITRDVYGTALPGATVRLFRTSDGALVDTVVSNLVTGAFTVSTPYWPDAHFIVASKSSSGEVTGASATTLVAA